MKKKVQGSRRRLAKGIFCLEGDWHREFIGSSTVQPLLDLLSKLDGYHVPYLRRDVATRAEFEYLLSKWSQRGMDRYPILYLAFDGYDSGICFGDVRRTENNVSLADLGELLEGRCKKRLLHFGSCETLGLHGNSIRGFLRRTEALAVCGYRTSVDFLQASAIDLIVLGAMQEHALTRTGVRAMKRRILERTPFLAKKLGFHMVVGS